jgi:hypothetical protein
MTTAEYKLEAGIEALCRFTSPKKPTFGLTCRLSGSGDPVIAREYLTFSGLVGSGFEQVKLPPILDPTSLSFWFPPITPDGEGGVDIHSERMVEGHLYPMSVGSIPLVAVKESDGSITLYGLPAEDG